MSGTFVSNAEKRRSFEQFKQAVNRALVKLADVFADDIPDWDYHSAFEDGISPKEAALSALVAAGWREEMFE